MYRGRPRSDELFFRRGVQRSLLGGSVGKKVRIDPSAASLRDEY